MRPWQSREGTGDSHRPPLKWYAPIASVAALSERHGQLQIWRHSRRMCNASKFVIARPQRGRGNLGKAVSFSPMAFLRSGYDLRDCTPRALPRASRSGRHVGLRPPRNDKSGAITVLSPTCTYRQCRAGPGCPLPYNALLILRTGPAWHRGKWPHGRGADTPVLSCNTGETPAPSRCRGRGPRA